MDKLFEVANHKEAEVFAFEELKAEFQLEIQKCLVDAGVSRRDLAKRMSCSPAWVTQALGDDANLTLESISKIFLALGKRCTVHSAPLDFHVEGYEDCDAITNDDGWRVSAPNNWTEEPSFDDGIEFTGKDSSSSVVSLLSYRKQNKRSTIKLDLDEQTETTELSSLELALAHGYFGK
ncbi:helix-turn-helix domain-containing protein [Roseibium sp.]|uniref:helix-turn-helix domain-containing protein n=1 Tax=Roseibium sp. TaxID=1936156 RepID=UPI0035146613